MTYDLLLAGDFDRATLAGALADLAGVPAAAVDIADRDAEDRAWDSPVLCTYEPAGGDVSWLLDIYVVPGAAREPDVSVAAGLIATQLGTPVLWAAQESLPSAFWLVTPDGARTRARVYEDDGAYRIEAIEKPLPSFPSARVEPLPEVIREHRVPTPVTDELTAWLADEDTVLPEGSSEAVRQAGIYLAVWEQLTERIAAGWPPDGWYPADFYRDDLKARDRLAAAVPALPAAVTGRFRWAIGRVDEKFKTVTHETTTLPVSGGDAWWWRRTPEKPGLV
ncbi:hypothetical protein [Actinoplanes subtropicus]|uniref:hypothetical protein n=1 Tax=Actinoplanes subtropicus TaxID=543632 RepID=UPI00068CD76F|nr:hypothetical protein [Actinoplanes subtropicus]